MNKRRQPRVLRIELPANRDYTGKITLLDNNGQIIAGPFEVCGRSGDELATEHGNPSRATTLPYGDTPLGTYRIAGFVSTGPGTRYRADLFGVFGAFVLEAKGGDAALADANGRFEILIHGGSLSSNGRLRATSGNMRVADSDLRILGKLIRRPSDVFCECVLAASMRAPNFVDRQNAEDTTVETLPTRTWITTSIHRPAVPMLVAYGEYDSGPSTQAGQDQTIDTSTPTQGQSDDFKVSSGNEPSTTNVPDTRSVGQQESQSPSDSPNIVNSAQQLAEEYRNTGVTYADYTKGEDPTAEGNSDCSHFVASALNQSGIEVPYTTTAQMPTSPYYQTVTQPTPGDVIVQGGHMGIFTRFDSAGRPLGLQMGTHGAQEGPFGPGGWFKDADQLAYYRPKRN
jgi:hypothetical protein